MRLVLLTLGVLAMTSTGCDKLKGGGGDAGTTTAAVTSGCGADYGSPNKQFCVKAPAGYTPTVGKPNSLTTEMVTFNHPVDDKGHYPSFDIQVGWRSDPHKSFDEEVKAKGANLADPRFKMLGSGQMPGGGEWWYYDQVGQMKRFESVSKTADGTPISCQAPDPPQDAQDACKSVRAYPK